MYNGQVMLHTGEHVEEYFSISRERKYNKTRNEDVNILHVVSRKTQDEPDHANQLHDSDVVCEDVTVTYRSRGGGGLLLLEAQVEDAEAEGEDGEHINNIKNGEDDLSWAWEEADEKVIGENVRLRNGVVGGWRRLKEKRTLLFNIFRF